MKKLLLASLGLMLANSAYTQVFKVTTSGCNVSASDCEQLRQEIQNEINTKAPSVSVDKYAGGMAKANKISAKGGTTDYANLFDIALVGVQMNMGVQADLEDTDNLENTASGLSVAPSVLVGLNLGVLPVSKIGSVEMKDLDVFFSFMSYNKDNAIDQDGIKLGGEFTHFGMQVRYNWIKEKDFMPGYLLQWTGVQLHTGYQYTHNKIDADYILNSDDFDPIEYNGNTATIDSGLATANIDHTTHTVPLEISTGLRFLYALTLYGGLATDFTLTSKSDAKIDATAAISSLAADYDVVGNQAGEGKADFFNSRAFVGFQVNIPFVRIFAQGHKYFGDDTYAVNAGVKVLY